MDRHRLFEPLPFIVGMTGMFVPFASVIADEPIKPLTAKAQSEADPGGGADNSESLPITKNVILRETLDAQNPQDGYEAIKSVAGVTNANSRGSISDNINIRGIPLSFSTSYRLNGGLPTANILAIPMENKDRIETLKGANALMFGIASPAGIVNLVTKRATDKDVSTLTFSGNAFGQYGGSVDFGRKFGDEKQFGVRVNVARTHLETGVDGGHGQAQFHSVAADWKVTGRLSFRLDVEEFSRDVIEQSTLLQLKPVNGVITVPRIPDPTKLLSGPWAHYRPQAQNLLLRGDYIISGSWKVLAEAGRAASERSRFISRIANYNLVTGQGTENITLVNNQEFVNKYAKAEVLGRIVTGLLKHDLTVGVMSSERGANVPSTTAVTISQNIYNPVVLPAPSPAAPLTYLPQISQDVGIYAYDTIAIGPRWQFLAGARRTTYNADNALAGGLHSLTTTKASSPAIGAIYNFTPTFSAYASYMKGLEETGIAPVGTVNQFQILPPAAATQSEVGVRATGLNGISANAAYFNITRANTVTNVASNIFLIDGTTKYQGLETTVSADLNRMWTANAAAQWMHSVQNSVIDRTINGLPPENTPRLTGNFSMTHRSAMVNGLTLTAGAFYTGPRAINPQNQASIPGVTLFSIGAGYVTKIAARRTSLQLNVDNLANKVYWTSAGAGAYGIGMVRNVKLSAKIEF